MRIDKLDSALTYGVSAFDKKVNGAETEQKAKCADCVSISSKTTVEDIKAKIKNNIEKLENGQVSEKRLEELKAKISQGEYFVDTDDIVNSIV